MSRPQGNVSPGVKAGAQNPFMADKVPMTLTGAAYFGETLKSRIQSAKDRITASHAKADSAVTDILKAADSADQIAEALTAEAQDLTATVMQFTNGAPKDTA